MTDTPHDPTPAEIHEAVTRIAGPDPANTQPYLLTTSLDPDDDIYDRISVTPNDLPEQPEPKAEDGTTGDQS